MSTLSKREIFLLFLMAVIVSTSLLFVFLINPLNDEIADNRDKLSSLEFLRQQTEINLSVIPTLRTRKDVRLKETETALNTIADPLHASEFERWILPVLSQNNARVTTVTLSDTRVATPDLIYTQVTPEVYRLLELIQDYNQINNTTLEPLPVSTTQLLFAEYSYQFSVTFENFINIIDTVKQWDTTYFVSNAFYDFSEREGNITVRVYGVQKLTEKELINIYKGDLGSHPNEIGPSKPSGNK